jgi:hypothetical protein
MAEPSKRSTRKLKESREATHQLKKFFICNKVGKKRPTLIPKEFR